MNDMILCINCKYCHFILEKVNNHIIKTWYVGTCDKKQIVTDEHVN